MKRINQKVIDKAKKQDEKTIQQQFSDLKRLLSEAGFRFKSISNTKLVIDLGINEQTVVKIYPFAGFGGFYKRFVIKLCNAQFESDFFKSMNSAERRNCEYDEASSLYGVLDSINTMLELFEKDEYYLSQQK